MGGTFDPVHLGHLESAKAVAGAYDLERVMMVLSARPPHKTEGPHATVEQRLAMLEIAAGDHPQLEASDLEVRRAGPSYTVDTVEELARANPADAFFLILGVDAYTEIDTWYRPADLLESANIIVTTRAGTGLDTESIQPPFAARDATCYDSKIGGYLHNSGHTLTTLDIDGLDISASEIRRLAAGGSDVAHLTGKEVAAYIASERVYGARES